MTTPPDQERKQAPMQALIYRCDTCWVEMRIIGRIERLRCPRCHEELEAAAAKAGVRAS